MFAGVPGARRLVNRTRLLRALAGAVLAVASTVAAPGPAAWAQTDTSTTTTSTPPDTVVTTTTTTVTATTTTTLTATTTTTTTLVPTATSTTPPDTTPTPVAVAEEPAPEPDPEPPPRRFRDSFYVGSVSALGNAQRAAVEDYLAAADRLARARTAGSTITLEPGSGSAHSERPKARADVATWRLANRAAVLAVERAAAGVTGLQQSEAALAAAEAEFARATDALTRVARGDPMITALLTGTPPPGDGFGRQIIDAQVGQGNPPSLTGLLAFPIPGQPIVSRFGYRVDPIYGDIAFHPGIDVGAVQGTPIVAAASGIVLFAGDAGGYGRAVVLDNGNSLATVYGHMASYIVAPGQVVAAGEIIGYVGSTGMSTGPHLHFEVRIHGVVTDPIPVLID